MTGFDPFDSGGATLLKVPSGSATFWVLETDEMIGDLGADEVKSMVVSDAQRCSRNRDGLQLVGF